MTMGQACIFSIQRASFVDGPGIRTTVFFKGCNLRCVWCHNPESWAPQPQLMFYKNRCLACGRCVEACPLHAVRNDFTSMPHLCAVCGRCAEACPGGAREISGHMMTTEEIFEEIIADKNFYGEDGGATFSGGECMLHIDMLEELLMRCRREHINTAVDTAGNVPFECFSRIEALVDWFLYDIKAFHSEVHERLTSAGNERILDNYSRLSTLCPEKVIVRIPVIPGANIMEMPNIAAFLERYPPRYVEFLPYHAMGVSKAEALGEPAFLTSTPDTEDMERLRIEFQQRKVVVK